MLEQAGHIVDTILFPYLPDVPEILDQRLALRLMDVARASDVLLTVGTPTFTLQHPRKVAWLYDLENRTGALSQTCAGRETLDAARHADTTALSEARHVFVTCEDLAREWAPSCQHIPGVLYPCLPVKMYCGNGSVNSNAFLYTHSPEDHDYSRLRLAVESLKETSPPIRLLVTGLKNTNEMNSAYRVIVTAGASHRVDILPNSPDPELLARCLGVLYLARNEKCYGLAFAEAVAARKCVVTASDAGAAAEILKYDEYAPVAAVSPIEIGAAMDHAFQDQEFAQQRGERAHEILYQWKSGPDCVVKRMLS
jgi:hypothetical protein